MNVARLRFWQCHPVDGELKRLCVPEAEEDGVAPLHQASKDAQGALHHRLHRLVLEHPRQTRAATRRVRRQPAEKPCFKSFQYVFV